MMTVSPLLLLPVAFAAALTACDTPSYRDMGSGEATMGFAQVSYQVHPDYTASPPDCVAILPFRTPPGGTSTAPEISIDQAETVRRAVYAHLAPQGKRDVELARIDYVLARDGSPDDATLGRTLNCDALITGEVTEYGSAFIGIYSRVAVGAELTMVRASDGTILWQGRHQAESHGGGLPLSPVGLAMGILNAASNVSEEQLLRVIDDLSRRLVSTIPDDRIAVLEDPAAPGPPGVALKRVETKLDLDAFLAQLERRTRGGRIAALRRALAEDTFGPDGATRIHDALVALLPEDVPTRLAFAEHLMDRGAYDRALVQADAAVAADAASAPAHFLRGRALIKLDDLAGADGAMVRAAGLDETNARYLDGLGYVNSVAGRHERALAAYRLAIDRDPADGFAYYNAGVTWHLLGDAEQAADGFYGAGLAYLKTGDYGQAQKALTDLERMVALGADAQGDVDMLAAAIDDLSTGGGVEP